MTKHLTLGIILGLGIAALPMAAFDQETAETTNIVSDLELDGDLLVGGNLSLDGEGVGEWTSDYTGDKTGNLKGGPWTVQCPNGANGDPQGVVVGMTFRRYREGGSYKDRYQFALICR